ncbi:MAG: T9SS type A sorting domain-containing protein, partial [Bacteroidia bacterium]
EINGKAYSENNEHNFNSYLLSLTEAGELRSHEIIPGAKIHDFDFDSSGNLYMIGAYDSIKVRGITRAMNACPYYYAFNCWEYFMAKLSPDGSCPWIRSIPRTFWTGWPGGFKVEQSGELFLSGVLNGGGFANSSLNLDGITIKNKDAAQAVFVYKFNSDGKPQWAMCSGGSSSASSFASDMACSKNGSLYISGNYQSATNRDNARLFFGNTGLPGVGVDQHMYIAKLDMNQDIPDLVYKPEEQENSWKVIPNPTMGQTLITCTCTHVQSVCITVRNFLGQVIFSRTYSAMNGELNENLDLGNNPKGIYFVELQSEEKRMVKRVVLD